MPVFTLERWSLIERSVAAARRQTVSPQSIVICVDNNDALLKRALSEWSGDDHEVPVRVVANASNTHLLGTGVHERAHGSSRRFGAGSSRNTGASGTTSDIIAFIDDDAWGEANWLEELLACYQDPSVVAVGGAALPYYETKRPAWFPDNFDWVFGCSYAGLPTSPGPLRHLIGSNMSVRRSAFESVDGFQGDDFDDLNLCLRLARRFGTESLIYTPQSVVHHYVTEQRTTWRYFYRRCYFVNREKARVLDDVGPAADLTAEREFVFRAVTDDLLALGRQGFRGDSAAFSRMGAMLLGIGLAGTGYLRGRMMKDGKTVVDG